MSRGCCAKGGAHLDAERSEEMTNREGVAAGGAMEIYIIHISNLTKSSHLIGLEITLIALPSTITSVAMSCKL